jgi:hypothetical protein
MMIYQHYIKKQVDNDHFINITSRNKWTMMIYQHYINKQVDNDDLSTLHQQTSGQ